MMFLVDPARRLRVEAALNATEAGRTMACSFTGEGATAWRAR
jgi:D-glycero-alpha-D-manno-heptose-7-phosphate kinase